MYATDPDLPPRRTDRRPCPTCAGTAALCKAGEWLRGESARCCRWCHGDHDAKDGD